MTGRFPCTALALLFAAACQPKGWENFSTRHASYRFAASDVVSKETANRRFIRLSPSGEPFELVFDSRIDGQMDRRGYRRIFSLGDGPLARVVYRPLPAGVMVCQTRVAAIECGLSLTSSGDQWSMLFPASREGEVTAMAARAQGFLAEHLSGKREGETPFHYRCADNSWLLVHEDGVRVRVDRPDLTRTLDKRTAEGSRSYAAQGFALTLEGGQARWIAPHQQPLPCFSTQPTA